MGIISGVLFALGLRLAPFYVDSSFELAVDKTTKDAGISSIDLQDSKY